MFLDLSSPSLSQSPSRPALVSTHCKTFFHEISILFTYSNEMKKVITIYVTALST